MSISNQAEQDGTPEAYAKMYEQFAGMSYSDAYNLLTDAKGVLETKCLLGSDTAKLDRAQVGALINLAKEIADLVEPSKVAYDAHQRHQSLTSSE